MKIIADTNVLLRMLLNDHSEQSRLAQHAVQSATAIVISTHTLCELVWVLGHSYKIHSKAIAELLRGLCFAERVVVDRPALEQGLHFLDSGGDFADGVIVWEGQWLGGEEFVSFDKKAVSLLREQGHKARLLS